MMNESMSSGRDPGESLPHHEMRLLVGDDIYAWMGNDTVLIVQCNDGLWTIGRGRLTADSLRDVRTWSFSSQRSALGQIRRLVSEAIGNADQAVEAAQAWMVDLGDASHPYSS
jgi:hypothetical protein